MEFKINDKVKINRGEYIINRIGKKTIEVKKDDVITILPMNEFTKMVEETPQIFGK